MQNEVKVSVNLQVALRLDGDTWIGVCPALDLASQGETEDLALQAVTDAVEVWFESCLERGVLSQALESSGFTRVTRNVVAPDGVDTVGISAANPISESATAKSKQISIELPAYIAASLIAPPYAPN